MMVHDAACEAGAQLSHAEPGLACPDAMHAPPMRHQPAFIACWQTPDDPSHTPCWQDDASVQVFGVILQLPVATSHTSSVQGLPSLHSTSTEQQPSFFPGLQVPVAASQLGASQTFAVGQSLSWPQHPGFADHAEAVSVGSHTEQGFPASTVPARTQLAPIAQ